MATWGSLLTNIREDLQDSGTTQKWSDTVLFLYFQDAVRNYSRFFPRLVVRTLIAENDGYALPTDFLSIAAVESPLDTFLEERTTRPGRKYTPSNNPKYYIDGSKIRLDKAATGDLYLTYYAHHSLPSKHEDIDFSLTIPEADGELIRLYVKGKVHEQLRGRTARLDRFKAGSGARDDNPLFPETNQYFADYYREIYGRLGGGSVELYAKTRAR